LLISTINSASHPSMPSLSLKRITSLVASLILLGVARTNGDVAQQIPEIGDLERWAVFSLGAGNGFGLAFGSARIDGDIGLAGNGKFLLAGRMTVYDDIYARSNGAVLVTGDAVLNGSVFYDQDALLDNCVNEALAASADALNLTPNRPYKSIKLAGNESMTVTGAPGETVVLSLKNFCLRRDSSLTLQGTAATTFIINVNKKFSLKGRSHIDLAGLQWNQVLFNVIGDGHKVSVAGNSVFAGILMANNRGVELKGNSTVSGEIIGNRLKFHGSSRVLHPAIVSQ
jgi:hypothetical protein